MRKFDKSLYGYNVNEVNAFVDDVVNNVDDMITKMKQKDMEIDRLTKELEHYKKMDETINRAVLIAEESSQKYQNQSISESDLIITEAKKNANRIINDALTKAEKYEEEAQRTRRNIMIYKRRLKDLVDQQAEIINGIDKVDL